jgi:LPS export ABC transporter protein LptC
MILRTILFIALALLLVACRSEKVKPVVNLDLNVEELPAQESWDSQIVVSDSGMIKAVMNTGHLRVFVEAQETLLDSGVKVDFYDEDEIKSTTLTSLRGRVNDATQDLYAYVDVVAINDSDGVKIETDELMWRNKDRKIVSDKFVTITTRDERIEGYGFESDQTLRNYVIRDMTYVTRTDTTGNGR